MNETLKEGRRPALSDRDRKSPKLRRDVDVRSLRISAAEGFLLSRLDGSLHASELADLVGMSELAVTEMLERLDGLGVLDWIEIGAARDARKVPEVSGESAANVSS